MPRNPNSGEQITTEAYLGDGVFASFDGANVWLRAPRNGRDHFVALNVENWNALRNFGSPYLSFSEHGRNRRQAPLPDDWHWPVRPQKDS